MVSALDGAATFAWTLTASRIAPKAYLQQIYSQHGEHHPAVFWSSTNWRARQHHRTEMKYQYKFITALTTTTPPNLKLGDFFWKLIFFLEFNES